MITLDNAVIGTTTPSIRSEKLYRHRPTLLFLDKEE